MQSRVLVCPSAVQFQSPEEKELQKKLLLVERSGI